ncbi:hypothetical protein ACFWFQ_32380, partial [Nocardia salmonicida]|uniref:hypothetical protein n=1 Tax=Nocardia salmonicida TaxID=53431 RepID=UPI00366206FF
MTTLESRVLAALAPGGMLTITTIARNVKSRKWAPPMVPTPWIAAVVSAGACPHCTAAARQA